MNKKQQAYKIGDYIAPDYVAHPSHLNEEAYSQALDSLVIACVDIAPVYEGKLLLGKRTRHPQADWFIFGGRMIAGERLKESARRLMRVEMNLTINAERIAYLTSFAAAWGKRAHEPENNGTHTVSFTMTVSLNDSELESLRLNDEYSDWKLVTLEDLLADEYYHPALHQCAGALKQLD